MSNSIVLYPEEIIPFDMMLSSIIGMNLHPGTTRDPPSKRSIEECVDLALKVIEVRRQKLGLGD